MEGPSLFVASSDDVVTVGEFASRVRAHVERGFADTWVSGEISNVRTPASGHCYFTLKDSQAQLRCVMWRSAMRDVPFRMRDGMRIRARGTATVYEPRGDLQLIVRRVKADGEGALQQQFEKLKRRLAAEGLFDAAHKKKLPALPGHVGIVTSGDGAALHDIVSIIARRFPVARASVHAVRVQGYGAAEEIVRALDAFGAAPAAEMPDVIILGRGGGSIEDLWAFNEEVVARAVHRCPIPVVSAVGHETDFSITDFVADVRAATPSMAAELVTPDRSDIVRRIRLFSDRMEACHRTRVERLRRRVLHLVHSYVFNRPLDRMRQQQQRVDELHERLQRGVLGHVTRHRSMRALIAGRLELLDPRLPLERGYVLVEKDSARMRRAEMLQSRDEITLQFLDGERKARIQE